MRSYFWVRENARGNVYAQSQRCGLSETTLLARNDSIDAENPCINKLDETLDQPYPKKEYILKEFCNRDTFAEEKAIFLNEMTRGGAFEADESLTYALNTVGDLLCWGHIDRAAITASTDMLHKTLMHFRVKPPLYKPCGCLYDDVSGKLLLSNCAVANCKCNILVFYHPYAWRYGFRTLTREDLRASTSIEWIGICKEFFAGNARWDVETSLDGYRFVDFAYFNHGASFGYPSNYASCQVRQRDDGNGVLVYDGSQKKPIVIQDQLLTYSCIGASCGETVFVARTDATSLQQQSYRAYHYTLTEWQGAGGIEARLFEAYTAVRHNGELGTCNLFYREYDRERNTSTAFSPLDLVDWMADNLRCHIYADSTGEYLPFVCAVLTDSGRKIGIYKADCAVGDMFCNKPVGAILKMGKCYYRHMLCAELPSNLATSGNVGEYIEGSGVPVLGFIGKDSRPDELVTFQTRESVVAKLEFKDFYLGVYNANAVVRFRLGVNTTWADYPSYELLAAFNEVAGDELKVYATTQWGIEWTMPQYGVTGFAPFTGGVETFTLGGIAQALGYSINEGNIAEIYEILTAGVDILFHANPYSSSGLVTEQIGIHPQLREEPEEDWTKR